MVGDRPEAEGPTTRVTLGRRNKKRAKAFRPE